MISRSSAGLRPTLKSTCAPGMRSRMVFASGERSSEMRMRIGGVLAADELDPVLLEEVLDQLLGIDAVGRQHGGHRRARTLGVEREPQRLHSRARGPGHEIG